MAEHPTSFNSDTDNDFEKVHHTDFVPPSPAAQYGGVEELTGSGGVQPETPPTVTSENVPSGVASPKAVPQSKPAAAEAHSSCCCAWVKNMDPRVMDLIYWRDVKKTGAVFGSAFVVLLSLALFSVLSVLAYLSLVVLTITLTYKLYRNLLATIQKAGDRNPFQEYLDLNVTIPEEKLHKMADSIASCINTTAGHLRHYFLIENVVDSLKFGLLLWLLTYVGNWFNGMTLIIIGLVGVFTLPKVYDVYQVPIDKYIEVARVKVSAIYKQIQEKLPMLGKKKQE